MSISLIDAKVFNGRIFKKSYDRLFNRIHTKYGETCEPFVITDKSWFMLGWSKDAEEIIIPDSFMLGKTYYQVVGVEGNAFKGFNNLKYLTITNTVVDIKYDFFVKSDFPKLEKVFIDNQLFLSGISFVFCRSARSVSQTCGKDTLRFSGRFCLFGENRR